MVETYTQLREQERPEVDYNPEVGSGDTQLLANNAFRGRAEELSELMAEALRQGKTTARQRGLYPYDEDARQSGIPREDIIGSANNWLVQQVGFDYQTLESVMQSAGLQDGVDYAWKRLDGPNVQVDLGTLLSGANPFNWIGDAFTGDFEFGRMPDRLKEFDKNPYASSSFGDVTGIRNWGDAIFAALDVADMAALGMGGEVVRPIWHALKSRGSVPSGSLRGEFTERVARTSTPEAYRHDGIFTEPSVVHALNKYESIFSAPDDGTRLFEQFKKDPNRFSEETSSLVHPVGFYGGADSLSASPKPTPVFEESVYHGAFGAEAERLGSYIDPETGELILYAASNFGGRLSSVSFTPSMDTAWDYGTRIKGAGPDARSRGLIFEIDRSFLDNRLVYEAEEELAINFSIPHNPMNAVRIPSDKFRVLETLDEKRAMQWQADRQAVRDEYRHMSNDEFAEAYYDDVTQSEINEHWGIDLYTTDGPSLDAELWRRFALEGPPGTPEQTYSQWMMDNPDYDAGLRNAEEGGWSEELKAKRQQEYLDEIRLDPESFWEETPHGTASLAELGWMSWQQLFDVMRNTKDSLYDFAQEEFMQRYNLLRKLRDEGRLPPSEGTGSLPLHEIDKANIERFLRHFPDGTYPPETFEDLLVASMDPDLRGTSPIPRELVDSVSEIAREMDEWWEDSTIRHYQQRQQGPPGTPEAPPITAADEAARLVGDSWSAKPPITAADEAARADEFTRRVVNDWAETPPEAQEELLLLYNKSRGESWKPLTDPTDEELLAIYRWAEEVGELERMFHIEPGLGKELNYDRDSVVERIGEYPEDWDHFLSPDERINRIQAEENLIRRLNDPEYAARMDAIQEYYDRGYDPVELEDLAAGRISLDEFIRKQEALRNLSEAEIDEIVRNNGPTDAEIQAMFDDPDNPPWRISGGAVNVNPDDAASVWAYPSPLVKIISGGQTGADVAGLSAGKELGLDTGGTAPLGWRTWEGPNPELGSKYGLSESTSSDWVPRTRDNVRNSDATILFNFAVNSRGSILTRNTAQKMNKLLYEINSAADVDPVKIRAWIINNDIKVLNVAGNRETSSKGINQIVHDALVEVGGSPTPRQVIGESATEINLELMTLTERKQFLEDSVKDIDALPDQYFKTREEGGFETLTGVAKRRKELQDAIKEIDAKIVAENKLKASLVEGAEGTVVHFNRKQNAVLSNFADSPFRFRGREYRTAEGAYQAYKGGSRGEGFEYLSGSAARSKGQGKYTNTKVLERDAAGNPTNWVNLDLMREILAEKYRQVPEFKAALDASTGPISHPVGDEFWRTNFPRVLEELRGTPAAGVVSEKVVTTLPMNFRFGQGGALPAGGGVTAESTYDAILRGERTATSRKSGTVDRPGVLEKLQVGDVIEFTNKGRSVRVRVTDKRPASTVSPEEWARVEGYDVEAVRENWTSGQWYSKYTQVTYEMVDDVPAAAPAAPPVAPAAGGPPDVSKQTSRGTGKTRDEIELELLEEFERTHPIQEPLPAEIKGLLEPRSFAGDLQLAPTFDLGNGMKVSNVAGHGPKGFLEFDRPFVVVQKTDGSFQPFYRSTGFNSQMGGTWLPFDGFGGTVQGYDVKWWLRKDPYSQGEFVKGTPLHRFGSEENRGISDLLGERFKDLGDVGPDSSGVINFVTEGEDANMFPGISPEEMNKKLGIAE